MIVPIVVTVIGCGLLLALAVLVAKSPASHKGAGTWRPKSPRGGDMARGHGLRGDLDVEDYVPEELRRSSGR